MENPPYVWTLTNLTVNSRMGPDSENASVNVLGWSAAVRETLCVFPVLLAVSAIMLLSDIHLLRSDAVKARRAAWLGANDAIPAPAIVTMIPWYGAALGAKTDEREDVSYERLALISSETVRPSVTEALTLWPIPVGDLHFRDDPETHADIWHPVFPNREPGVLSNWAKLDPRTLTVPLLGAAFAVSAPKMLDLS